MPKYIDADALKEAIVKMMPHDKCGEETPEEMAAIDMAVSVIQEIDEMPTVDMESVRHGDWKHISADGFWRCSECGYPNINSWYCQNCGSEMGRGEKSE